MLKESEVLQPKHPLMSSGDRLTACALSLLFFTLYYGFHTSCHTFDSLVYVSNAQIPDWTVQFHPHHLLYHQILFLMNKIIHWLNLDTTSLLKFLTLPSALFGGLSVGIIYVILRRFCSQSYALLGAAASGSTYSMISMATDIEKYPIALFFLLNALRVMLKSDNSPSHTITSMTAGVFIALATVIHQASMMFILLPVIVIAGSRDTLRKRYLNIAVLLVIAGTLVVSAYGIVAGLNNVSGVSGLMNWSTSYVQSQRWGFGFSESPKNWIAGNLGAQINLGIWQLVNNKTRFLNVLTELCFAILFMVSGLLTLKNMFRKSRQGNVFTTGLAIIAWIAAYSIFIIWWEPLNTKVALLYTPGVWIFISIFLRPERHQKSRNTLQTVLFVTLLGSLCLINWTTAVHNHRETANPHLADARAIAENSNKNDIILTPYSTTTDRYLFTIFDRPRTFTLRSLRHQLATAEELTQIVEDSTEQLCDSSFSLLLTQESCLPSYREDPTGLPNSEIRKAMKPYLNKATFICELPSGDLLMRLTPRELCD